MKPRKIFLIRHGESVGNVDKSTYNSLQDWKLPLTPKGCQQAERAAKRLLSKIGNRTVAIYSSPFYRARETAKFIREAFDKRKRLYESFRKVVYKEDPRIREQEWGNLKSVSELHKTYLERREFGRFFYRIRDGESGADVFDRLASFCDTFWRDFESDNFPYAAILSSHGLTIRVFLMKWFHWSVERYDECRNIHNGEIIEMKLNEKVNRYELITNLGRRKK